MLYEIIIIIIDSFNKINLFYKFFSKYLIFMYIFVQILNDRLSPVLNLYAVAFERAVNRDLDSVGISELGQNGKAFAAADG